MRHAISLNPDNSVCVFTEGMRCQFARRASAKWRVFTHCIPRGKFVTMRLLTFQ